MQSAKKAAIILGLVVAARGQTCFDVSAFVPENELKAMEDIFGGIQEGVELFNEISNILDDPLNCLGGLFGGSGCKEAPKVVDFNLAIQGCSQGDSATISSSNPILVKASAIMSQQSLFQSPDGSAMTSLLLPGETSSLEIFETSLQGVKFTMGQDASVKFTGPLALLATGASTSAFFDGGKVLFDLSEAASVDLGDSAAALFNSTLLVSEDKTVKFNLGAGANILFSELVTLDGDFSVDAEASENGASISVDGMLDIKQMFTSQALLDILPKSKLRFARGATLSSYTPVPPFPYHLPLHAPCPPLGSGADVSSVDLQDDSEIEFEQPPKKEPVFRVFDEPDLTKTKITYHEVSAPTGTTHLLRAPISSEGNKCKSHQVCKDQQCRSVPAVYRARRRLLASSEEAFVYTPNGSLSSLVLVFVSCNKLVYFVDFRAHIF